MDKSESVEELITWLRVGTWGKYHLGAAVWLRSLQAGNVDGGCPSPPTLLDQRQSIGGIFQSEILKWCLSALGFSSLQATKWRSQTEKRPGGERGLHEGIAQGWPQHLSSSFEAWKLPSVGQMGLLGSDSWGGRGQEGWKRAGQPSPRCRGTFGVHVASGSSARFSGISSGERKSRAIWSQEAALLSYKAAAASCPGSLAWCCSTDPKPPSNQEPPPRYMSSALTYFLYYLGFFFQTAKKQTVASLTLTTSCSSNWTSGLAWLAASSWHHCLIFQLLEQQIAGKDQRGRDFSFFLPPHCFSLGPEHQSQFAFHWRHTLFTYDGKMSGSIRRNGG